MSLPQNLGRLSAALTSDASLNIGVGVTPSGSFKFEVGTTSKFTGVATFGSTLSNGTYSYTLPGATGTLALVGGAGVGTVTSVAAITLGTSGTDLSSTVANGTTTPVITLNVPDASAANRGVVTTGTQTFAGAKTFSSQLTLSSTLSNGTYTYTLPSATGTLALTSALSGYLPLTGGTLSGLLNITTSGGNNALLILNRPSTVTSSFIGFSTNGTSNWLLGTNALGTNLTDFYLYNYSTGSSNLSFSSSTGAATFSSGIATLGYTASSSYAALFNGSVGIGIATPAVKFEVQSSGSNSFFRNSSATATTTYITVVNANNSSNGLVMAHINDGTGYFGTQNSADLRLVTGDVERMRITSGGNVGIGTTSPSSVSGYGVVSLNGTNGSLFNGMYNGTSSSYFGTDSVSTFVYELRNAFLGFGTNGAERMRITSGGNVLIGTTTDNGAKFRSSGGAVHLEGNGAFLTLNSTNSNTFKIVLQDSGTVRSYLGADGTNAFVFGSNSASTIATINNSTGVYTPLSDINKKKDFEQSEIGLNAILGLKPTLYRMKTDANNTDKHLGFIAQEVKEFIPQAYKENGYFIGLDYNPIIAALVKGIQEQQAQIEELKALIKK